MTPIPQCYNCKQRYDLLPLDGTEEAVCEDCLDAILVAWMMKDAK
jgi:hypothetical protein